MLYFVTIGQRTFEVDLTGESPRIDGDPIEVSLTRVADTPTLHLLADGRSHTLIARRDDTGSWDLHMDGERFVADVVDDEIATEILESACGGDHVARGQIVTHDLDIEVPPGLHHAPDGFLMGPLHHDHVGGTGPGHHLGLEIASVHCFQIRDNRHIRKSLTETADRPESLGEDQGRARLQPVHAGPQGHGGGADRLIKVGQIEGDLHDRLHAGDETASLDR